MFVKLLLALLCIVACSNIADASPFAYTANKTDSSITVIDLENPSNPGVITLPGEQRPFGVAVNRFGSRVYVSDRLGSIVTVIDTVDNSTGTINVAMSPGGLAVNPAGTRLYVTHPDDDKISVFDTADKQRIGTAAATGNNPTGVAVKADGSRVFVTNTSAGSVSVFDADLNLIATVDLGANGEGPVGVAVHPSANKIYVANMTSGALSVLETTDNTNYTVTTVSNVGSMPYGVALNADGSRLYVTVRAINGGTEVGEVAVYDTSNNQQVGDKITVGNAPMGISVVTSDAPTSQRVLTANSGAATATIIDTNNNNAVTTVNVGSGPESLGNFVGPRLFDITLEPAYDGTILPTVPITVDQSYVLKAPKGLDLPLNIRPDANCIVKTLTVDGVDKKGELTGTAPDQVLTIPAVAAVHDVIATFERTGYIVTVRKLGSQGLLGYGRVYSTIPTSPTLDCGNSCTSQSTVFNIDTNVKLKAENDANALFLGWGGTGCSTGDCTFKVNDYYAVNGEIIVNAYFGPAATLQAAYNGATDGGTVSCAAAYSEAFDANISKTVTLAPNASNTTLTGSFTVSLGTINVSGGGSLIIQ